MSIGITCRANVRDAEKMLRSTLDTSREWKRVANTLRAAADQARKVAKLATKMEQLGGKVVKQLKYKRGVYKTEYGTDAYVAGPKAKTAFDLDTQRRIPINLVEDSWVRNAETLSAVRVH